MDEITTTSTSSMDAIKWQLEVATYLLQEIQNTYFNMQPDQTIPTTEQAQRLTVEFKAVAMKLDAINLALAEAWENTQH